MRLIWHNPNPMYARLTPGQDEHPKERKWTEVHHYLPMKGEFFASIYFGVNIDPTVKEKIMKYARKKLNPQISLYQMRVDDGDILYIDCRAEIHDGDMVLAMPESGEYLVKNFYTDSNEVSWLIPCNDKYKPIPLDKDDSPVIVGKVVNLLMAMTETEMGANTAPGFYNGIE